MRIAACGGWLSDLALTLNLTFSQSSPCIDNILHSLLPFAEKLVNRETPFEYIAPKLPLNSLRPVIIFFAAYFSRITTCRVKRIT